VDVLLCRNEASESHIAVPKKHPKSRDLQSAIGYASLADTVKQPKTFEMIVMRLHVSAMTTARGSIKQ
jgi:hypothetical protein